jgi:peptidoglycan/LPS O-acetylase OafA/YrhL
MPTDTRRRAAKTFAMPYKLSVGARSFGTAIDSRDVPGFKPVGALRASDQLRYTFLFLPIILVAFQSYYKLPFIKTVSKLMPVGAIGVYWGVRLLLFCAFLGMLFFASPTAIRRPERPLDPYSRERSARDPLLGLRALACLNVFFGHWFMVVFRQSTPAQSVSEYGLRAALSFSPWCGVWMFFTLSGYLMGKGFVTGRHSVDRAGLKTFYRNRVLRIFPIYFISIFLVSVFVYPSYLDLRSPAALNSLLEACLFDQQAGGVIGALWSVSTEFQFYLLAPMLFLSLSTYFKTDVSRVCGVAILCFLFGLAKFWIITKHPEMWHSRVYFPLTLNLDCFLAGMVTAFVVNGRLKNRFQVPNGIAIGIGAAVLAQVVFSAWSFHEMAFYEGVPGSSTRPYFLSFAPGVTALATCAIIGLFELSKRAKGEGNVFWRISTALGALTYCMYVFHEPVIVSLRRLWPASITMRESAMFFPFGFAVSLTIAFLFYYFIEQRVDRIRR